MQYFGILETKYEEVFLTSSYLYFNDDEERYNFYGSQETGILTDIDYFNNLTKE